MIGASRPSRIEIEAFTFFHTDRDPIYLLIDEHEILPVDENYAAVFVHREIVRCPVGEVEGDAVVVSREFQGHLEELPRQRNPGWQFNRIKNLPQKLPKSQV